MQIGALQYLIVCPLVFLAGFVDSVAGGGGLISLPAYLLAGLPAHFAIGTNKVSSAMGTAVATFRYSRSGYIDWKMGAGCTVFALAGSALGARIALLIDDNVFKIIMLFILPLTALYIMRGNAFAESTEPYGFVKTLAIGSTAAFVIGMYDGFYGPGTGTFLILVLSGIAHMKLTEANGIAKVINLSTNIAALIVYLCSGKIAVLLGLTAGAFSIAGNYAGTKAFVRGGAKIARPIMMTVIALFFVKVAVELFG